MSGQVLPRIIGGQKEWISSVKKNEPGSNGPPTAGWRGKQVRFGNDLRLAYVNFLFHHCWRDFRQLLTGIISACSYTQKLQIVN